MNEQEETLDCTIELKRLDSVLNNKSETFENKVQSLIEVWQHVAMCHILEQSHEIIGLMNWLRLHTLNIVLTSEWESKRERHQERLLSVVQHCEMLSSESNSIFSLRCKKLADVIKDPWGNPVLYKLMKNSNVDVGQEEIDFFAMETGYVISTRLKKLCESQCEDLALNLVAAFMHCSQIAKETETPLNVTADQRRFILDVYIALLYKYKRNSDIVSELKLLSIEEGLKLVRRFANKRINISKIWKRSLRISNLAARMYLTAALTKPNENTESLLEQLLEVWLSINDDPDVITTAVRHIMRAAEWALHIYIFSEAIYKKFGLRMKTFTIELFIRALTTDTNAYEVCKHENNQNKLDEIVQRLSNGLLRLADILDDNVKVSRECVLTAFSLHPTWPTLERIMKLAVRSGLEALDTGQNWKCKLHPPVSESDEICFTCKECGELMSYLDIKTHLNTDLALNDALTVEQLGLSDLIVDDLAVLLSCLRYQLFSWLLPWKTLHRLCCLYVHKPRIIKNFVEELKFVDIDYSIFKRIKSEPLDDDYGIERGYEKYLDERHSSEDDRDRSYAKVLDHCDSFPEDLSLFGPTSTSNPDIIKSLRQFRPNLKRPKVSDTQYCSAEIQPNTKSMQHRTSPSLSFNLTPCDLSIPGKQFASTVSQVNNVTPNNIIPTQHRTSPSFNLTPCGLSIPGEQFASTFRQDNNDIPNNTKSMQHRTSPSLNLTPCDLSIPGEQFASTFRQDNNVIPNYSNIQAHQQLTRSPYQRQEIKYTSPPTYSTASPPAWQTSQILSQNSIFYPREFDAQEERYKAMWCRNLIQNVPSLISLSTVYSDSQISEPNSFLNSRTFCVQEDSYKNISCRNLIQDTPSSSITGIEEIRSSTETTTSAIENTSSSIDKNFLSHDINGETTELARCFSTVSASLSISNIEEAESTIDDGRKTPTTCNFSTKTNSPASTRSYPSVHEEGDSSSFKNNDRQPEQISELSDSDSDVIYVPPPKPRSPYSDSDSDLDFVIEDKNRELDKGELLNEGWDEPVIKSLSASRCDSGTDNLRLHRSDDFDLKKISDRSFTAPTLFTPCMSFREFLTALHNPFVDIDACTASYYARNKIMTETLDLNPLLPSYSSCIVTESNKSDDLQKFSENEDITRVKSPLKTFETEIKSDLNRNNVPNFPLTDMFENVLPHNESEVIEENRKKRKCFDTEEPLESSVLKNKKIKGGEGSSTPEDHFFENGPPFNRTIDDSNLNTNPKSATELNVATVENGRPDYVECQSFTSDTTSMTQERLKRAENTINDSGEVLKKLRQVKKHRPRLFESSTKKCEAQTYQEFVSKKVEKKVAVSVPNIIELRNRKRQSRGCRRKLMDGKNPVKCICHKLSNTIAKTTRKRKTQFRPGHVARHAYPRHEDKNKSKSNTSTPLSDTKDNYKMLNLIKKYNLKELRVVLHKYEPSELKGSLGYKKLSVAQRRASKISENKKRKTRTNAKQSSKSNSSWPLQDINPKVDQQKEGTSGDKIICNDDSKNLMNPRVVLKRLEDDKKRNSSVLSSVPGLNDLQLIRPSCVDRIVQVVQVTGTRTTTGPVQSTQTSTQISPHIQRIGQPRNEKPELTNTESSSTTITNTVITTSASPVATTSESSTLINILSQQIVRPGNQNNIVTLKPRNSPLINILSQQIIKPVTTATVSKSNTTGNTEVQVNSLPTVITGGDQILGQIINPARTPTPALKSLVGTQTTDQNRIVQFICKSSDGKLIPVTSFTSNKVVKVSMTQTVTSGGTGTGNAEENFTKLSSQTVPKLKTDTENSDTLPKFQQAFGKPAYQKNMDSTERVVSVTNETVNSDLDKNTSGGTIKTPAKNLNASLNIQQIQGGVIYTRQMPVGQAINLIPPGRGQVFRIATTNPEQLSLVKDSVIHGKMSALLAAALQGKQRAASENSEGDASSEENSTNNRPTLTTRPTLVQSARIVKPVLQIPSNVIRSTPQSNLSSTTLEQLREFDMVYKQVKERSSTGAPIESSPQSDSNETPTQQISVTYLNQNQKINCPPVVVVSTFCTVQPAASPSINVTSQGNSSPCVTPAPTLTLAAKTVTKTTKTKNIKNTTTHPTKATPLPKPQQKPQEDEYTTQRIFDILAEYAEQLRNSPDLNNKPAPRRRSNPPTNPNQNAKRKKNSNSKKTGQCSNSLTSEGDTEDAHTAGSEDSSCGVVQISMQEEEQPVPPSTSESNESSVSPKQLILTDSPNQSRNLIIADSNVGEALKMSNTAVLVPGNYIMPVSMVKGGQQIAVVSGGSKILATVPTRSGPNMLLFQSFLNQSRKHNVPTVKYSAVQPVSGVARNVSNANSQTTIPPTSENLTSVSLAQTAVALQKGNQSERAEMNNFDTELLLTISHRSDNKNIIEQQQSQTPQSQTIPREPSNETVQNIKLNDDTVINSKNSTEKILNFENKPIANTCVTTSVITQPVSIKDDGEQPPTQTIMALNLNSDCDKDSAIKVESRVQSVLVATGATNGPMLSHSPPVYNKQSDSSNSVTESAKDEYNRTEGKRNSAEAKTLQTSIYAYQGKHRKVPQKLDRDLQQLTLQRKQAALERELRLQKSLSEECEDLGVDEPSTSDLFPEADLLFDSNHSPSFDQSSQDLIKRASTNAQEAKDEPKPIGLFCDDESMKTDFLFESIEYPSGTELVESKEQGNTNETGLSCSISDGAIPSPVSPDPYGGVSPPPFSKNKYKYHNRKKVEKSKPSENWPIELSSSEDTTGSSELVKSSSCSPELCSNKRNQTLSCEDEDFYGFAIVERLPLKEEGECTEVHCEEVLDCPSGRGARRSVKKLCSCCNGSAKVSRKRPASQPSTTPFTGKKNVPAKKR